MSVIMMDKSDRQTSLTMTALSRSFTIACVVSVSELIPHERVIAELEKDTQSTDTGLGLPPGCFQCGHFPQLLVVEVKVEEEKYERGVQWLRDVLYGTQFTAERLKIIANRKIGDISSLKRSGSKIVRTLLQDLVFSRGLLTVCLPICLSVSMCV